MDKVKIYTTPAFTMLINDGHQVSNITKAEMAISHEGEIVLEKDLASAVVDSNTNTISWELSQIESGALPADKVFKIDATIKFSDGKAVGNEKYYFTTEDSAIKKVL